MPKIGKALAALLDSKGIEASVCTFFLYFSRWHKGKSSYLRLAKFRIWNTDCRGIHACSWFCQEDPGTICWYKKDEISIEWNKFVYQSLFTHQLWSKKITHTPSPTYTYLFFSQMKDAVDRKIVHLNHDVNRRFFGRWRNDIKLDEWTGALARTKSSW